MGNLILNSLEIRGFRAFEHLEIERLGRVNLIVGKNNVGKTALLEALQLYVRNGSIWTIREILGMHDENKLPFFSKKFSIDPSLRDLLPAIRYMFHGREEVNGVAKTIHIGPIDTPEETLTVLVGGSVSQNTEEDLGPRFSVHKGKQQIVNYAIATSLIPKIPMLEPKGGIKQVFVKANGLSEEQITTLWDNIALTSREKEVVNALRLVAPGTEVIGLVSDTTSTTGERIPIVKIASINEPLALRSLGDGMQRMFGIALALVNAKDGMLLIDEIENGLHHEVLSDLWQLIFRVARQLNVQVFATTHSWNTMEGFQEAVEADEQNEGLLIRLERKKGKAVTTLFDRRRLGVAIREQIEVR